jgi:ubiquinone/menaquinone biosynthesis C-methylase UbiE
MAFDQRRFSTIAHRDHTLCNPLSLEKVDRVLALFDLPPGARVADVGCGKAEMLMRLIERYGCTALGVDSNADFLAEARARAFDRGVAGQLELVESEARDWKPGDQKFDAVLCVGATHAYGDLAGTLEALNALVKPGGLVLVGEGYWRKKPDAAYLKVLGAKAKDFTDHAGNVEAGAAAKLTCLYSAAGSEDDFDHYEGLYARAIESHCLENPDDADVEPMRKRIREWRTAYLTYGRDTLGFGLYLFRAR